MQILTEFTKCLAIAVLGIARNRMIDIFHMYAYLMRSACFQEDYPIIYLTSLDKEQLALKIVFDAFCLFPSDILTR